ncbi:MAG TPA: hypothetical protein VK009_26650, partial [Chloroflexota bacterium]|nr:hypothetical protein [Chloroflexota bacterium]
MSLGLRRRNPVLVCLLAAVVIAAALAYGAMTAGTTKAAPGAVPFNAINQPGFGDRTNGYSQSMQWFNGRLYVGTARNAQCGENAILDHYFPQYGLYSVGPADEPCPANKYDIDQRAEIWRYTPSTRAWDRVFQSTQDIPNPLAPGKYVSRDTTFRGMTVYTAPDGTQNLYAAGLTDGEYIPGLPGPRIIRSTDGSNFAPVNLVLPAAVQTRKGLQPILGFRSLVVFNGRLFMTATPTSVGDGVVMEATPGDSSGGTLILKQVGPADLDVFEMEVFNGYLYVGAGDEQYGYSVWKTQATGVGPYLFTPVVTNGAGRGA